MCVEKHLSKLQSSESELCTPSFTFFLCKIVADHPPTNVKPNASVNRPLHYVLSRSTYSIWYQITNQMITACKAFITDNGAETVWSQPRDEVLKKLKDSIKLNEEYQKQFHKTKVSIQKKNIQLICSKITKHLRGMFLFQVYFTHSRHHLIYFTPNPSIL